ncbi:MAG TPA: SCO family protein [Candidatus Limnocylindria bacterium]|nr:SCO family protein [Candidatus Limnocylindria bacterium]
MKLIFPVGLLGLMLWAGGCSPSGQPDPAGTPVTEAVTNYPARGIVQAVRPDGRTVVIKHEEIADYMMAMTMPFVVRDTNELKGLKPGELIEFRLCVTAKDSWVDQLKIVGAAPAPSAPATNAASLIHILPNVPELKAGDLLPDYTFTNQLGQAVHLAEYRGKALAFTFIFTRCPLPNFCPRISDNFATVQRRLKQTPDAPDNWRLLSLSFDPEYDTAERLTEYGQRFGQDPSRWSLANGSFDQIERLAGNFGLYFARDVGVGEQNHNLRTVVVDATGHVQDILIGNEWTVDDLAKAITQAAQVK